MSESQMTTRIPWPSRERAQVFGYTLRDDWIMDFGRKRNVDRMGEKTQMSLFLDSLELIRDEIKENGEFASVRLYQSAPPDVPAQIYVARNFAGPMKGSTTIPLIRAKVEKLKKFLDTPEEPRWMNL